MSILISIFISGYYGKTTDFAKNSSCHRTTIAHFLSGQISLNVSYLTKRYQYSILNEIILNK